MRNLDEKKNRGQKGELMIESMLVMIPVLFVLVFIFCLGFFMYQQWNVQTTATETANKIGELYPLIEVDLKEGVSSFSQVENMPKYRYLTLFGHSDLEGHNREKGTDYAKRYLSLISLAYPASAPDIKIEVKNDACFMRHITVDVSGEYNLPFGEGFEVFGLKSKYVFTGHGESVCTDMSDYISSVNYIENLEELLHLNDIHGYKALNSVMKLIKDVAAVFEKLPANHKTPE